MINPMVHKLNCMHYFLLIYIYVYTYTHTAYTNHFFSIVFNNLDIVSLQLYIVGLSPSPDIRKLKCIFLLLHYFVIFLFSPALDHYFFFISFSLLFYLLSFFLFLLPLFFCLLFDCSQFFTDVSLISTGDCPCEQSLSSSVNRVAKLHWFKLIHSQFCDVSAN